MSWFGMVVRRQAGKQKDLGSIPLQLSFLFKKVVVHQHCLVTVHHFLLIQWNIRMALITAHPDAGIILVVIVQQ